MKSDALFMRKVKDLCFWVKEWHKLKEEYKILIAQEREDLKVFKFNEALQGESPVLNSLSFDPEELSKKLESSLVNEKRRKEVYVQLRNCENIISSDLRILYSIVESSKEILGNDKKSLGFVYTLPYIEGVEVLIAYYYLRLRFYVGYLSIEYGNYPEKLRNMVQRTDEYTENELNDYFTGILKKYDFIKIP